jgi:hypothetical protein
MSSTPGYNRAIQILIGVAVCIGWFFGVMWVVGNMFPNLMR